MKHFLLLIGLLLSTANHALHSEAIFGGGCFWCLEADFDKLPGVKATVSGYDGGQQKNPSYQLVSSGSTQYVEVVKVIFDPSILSYRKLLEYYWRHIDPLDFKGQFCDKGNQYRSIIFYVNTEQKQAALATKRQVIDAFDAVATEVLPSTHFVPAEQYHQNYYKKKPLSYRYYRYRCGRDARIKEVWNHVTLFK